MIEMTYAEWINEAKSRFGDDPKQWKFICPVCGYVASLREWREAGAPIEAAAFSCVGRWKGAGTGFGKNMKGPCDYAGGGLFRLNPIRVIRGEEKHEVFAFAEVTP